MQLDVVGSLKHTSFYSDVTTHQLETRQISDCVEQLGTVKHQLGIVYMEKNVYVDNRCRYEVRPVPYDWTA